MQVNYALFFCINTTEFCNVHGGFYSTQFYVHFTLKSSIVHFILNSYIEGFIQNSFMVEYLQVLHLLSLHRVQSGPGRQSSEPKLLPKFHSVILWIFCL